MSSFELRPAQAQDVPAIVGLITELAEFEHLTHLVKVTPETLHPHLFGDKPAAESWVAVVEGRVVGFALFFTNFSTFLGKPGVYLEELYLQHAVRCLGLGKALLGELARIAVARDCARLEWWVLDWNEPSIAFYKSLGAKPMDEWTVMRVDGAALAELASAD